MLTFMQTLVFMLKQRRQEILQDAAITRLDVDVDRHAGRERDGTAVDIHRSPFQDDAAGV